ncbi:glycosyltransferase [Paenibacillus sp. 481]|uniref:glycosyltransferase n=1 Tax=Paenibacillus sp. 481 TaxID=2835869 RepID=UPI001E513ADE|nr:glycosyltransferase [Paenibacillus sp. 481]UHA71964.1 glycosyltransferase [Paenibacillus sp. 481]
MSESNMSISDRSHKSDEHLNMNRWHGELWNDECLNDERLRDDRMQQTRYMEQAGQKEARPRIAFFITSLAGGGAEKVVTMLLRGLDPAQYELHLIVNRLEGPYVPLLPFYVQVTELQSARLRSALPILVKQLKRIQPHVVVSHMWENNVLATLANIWGGFGYGTLLCEHSAISYRRALGTDALRGWCYRRSDAVVGCSEQMGMELHEWLGIPDERIQVVPNPIIDHEFEARAAEPCSHQWLSQLSLEQEMFEQQVGQPKERFMLEHGAERRFSPVLIGVGRLVPEKRFDLFITAISRVRELHPHWDVRGVIVGEGVQRRQLEDLKDALRLQNVVDLPGYVSNPLPYLRAAHLFVQTSDVEGLPTALVEAVACGTDVVATCTATGTEEVLCGVHNAALVPCGNMDVIVSKLIEMLERQEQQWLQRFEPQQLELKLDMGLEMKLGAEIGMRIGMDQGQDQVQEQQNASPRGGVAILVPQPDELHTRQVPYKLPLAQSVHASHLQRFTLTEATNRYAELINEALARRGWHHNSAGSEVNNCEITVRI